MMDCIGQRAKFAPGPLPTPTPTDGCSCHNTATAVAALGGFLYILAEYHPDNGDAHLEYYPNNGDPYSSTQSPASNYQDGAAGPDIQRIGRPLSIS